MGVERPQGGPSQRLLFPEFAEGLRHGDPGEGGTGTGAFEERTGAARPPPTRFGDFVNQPAAICKTISPIQLALTPRHIDSLRRPPS